MIVSPQNGRAARATRTPDMRRLNALEKRDEAIRRAAFYRDRMTVEARRGDWGAAMGNEEHYFRQLHVIERLDAELERAS